MDSKNIVTLVLVLSCFAAHISASQRIAVADPKDGIKDLIKAIVGWSAKLTELLSGLLDIFSKFVAAGKTKLPEIESVFSVILYERAVRVLNFFLKELTLLHKTADKAGKKLIGCMRREFPKVVRLLNPSITEFIGCTGNDLPDFFKGGEQLLLDLSASLKNVTTSLKKLESCPGTMDICAPQFMSEVVAIGKDLFKAVKTDNRKLIELMKKFPDVVTSCAIITIHTNDAVVFNNITTCYSGA